MNRWLLLLFVCVSCHRPEQAPPVDEEAAREHMIGANRILVQQEAEDIRDFIVRHGWTMQKTGTGLHYEIFQEGRGRMPVAGAPLTISYTVYLLDGTFCYATDSLRPMTFLPGKGQQPRGLEEALERMREGSRSRLVLPAHLAYGTAGDGNKIPGNSALYYDVQLIKISDEK